jgi:hypothetical protein
MSWVKYNQDYEYRFHDKNDRVQLIKNNFAEEVLQAYHLLDNGAFKADLWRYCVLYLHGGVYADIDTVCQRMLSKLIKNDDQFIVSTSPVNGAVFSAFLCTIPQHPFMKKLIDRAVELILSRSPIKQFAVVGPLGLGTAMNLTLGRDKEHIFEVGQYQVKDFCFRILRKILKRESVPCIMDGDEIVCLNKYEGYDQDLESMSITYWKKSERQKKRMKGE